MPLSQSDPSLDYGGSWGDASSGWPKLKFKDAEAAKFAHYLAWKVAKVPYGSYVLVDSELRLENQAYVDAVRRVLKTK